MHRATRRLGWASAQRCSPPEREGDGSLAPKGPSGAARFQSSSCPQSRSRYFAIVLLAFFVAAAAFVAANMSADMRLKRSAKLAHDVSENAMPSLALIGTMRRALANIHLDLDEAARGYRRDLSSVDAHLQELGSARRDYEALPQFPKEPEAWARARRAVDTLLAIVPPMEAEVNSGALAAAEARVRRDLAPADAAADAALAEVQRIDLEGGTRSAQMADRAWARSRQVSLVLDLACTGLTVALAWVALRSSQRYAAAEARRGDELDAFAARVAHDLRGPLTTPMLALQSLARELPAESPHRSMVDKGLRSLHRAEVLIRDLLVFARAAAAPDAEGRASLPAVVAGVVQDLEPEASAAKVDLVATDLVACQAHCAPGVLASILENLVGNAIKYMPPDAKVRRVEIRASESANRLRVEVADTGAGVPGEAHARIFAPYVRADSSRPGLGLGLATVKRLVDAHGGRVGVQSNPSGSVFWIELPCSVTMTRPTGTP